MCRNSKDSCNRAGLSPSSRERGRCVARPSVQARSPGRCLHGSQARHAIALHLCRDERARAHPCEQRLRARAWAHAHAYVHSHVRACMLLHLHACTCKRKRVLVRACTCVIPSLRVHACARAWEMSVCIPVLTCMCVCFRGLNLCRARMLVGMHACVACGLRLAAVN